jgi:hypothetical protein
LVDPYADMPQKSNRQGRRLNAGGRRTRMNISGRARPDAGAKEVAKRLEI